jgi:hypothetical protein
MITTERIKEKFDLRKQELIEQGFEEKFIRFYSFELDQFFDIKDSYETLNEFFSYMVYGYESIPYDDFKIHYEVIGNKLPHEVYILFYIEDKKQTSRFEKRKQEIKSSSELITNDFKLTEFSLEDFINIDSKYHYDIRNIFDEIYRKEKEINYLVYDIHYEIFEVNQGKIKILTWIKKYQ